MMALPQETIGRGSIGVANAVDVVAPSKDTAGRGVLRSGGVAMLRCCDVAGPDQMLLPLLLIAPTLVMAMASGVN